MKNRNIKVAALAATLILGSFAITSALNLIARHQPFYQPTDDTSYAIYDFLHVLVTIILQVILLGFAYTRFRKVYSTEKAQWIAVIVSTVALTLAPIVSLLVIIATANTGAQAVLEDYLHPVALLGSLIMSFLLSLGVVYLIATSYKRRSGFEVE